MQCAEDSPRTGAKTGSQPRNFLIGRNKLNSQEQARGGQERTGTGAAGGARKEAARDVDRRGGEGQDGRKEGEERDRGRREARTRMDGGPGPTVGAEGGTVATRSSESLARTGSHW